jgi:WD40 repeat protein/predicted Ser/Thr protein kinase
MNPHQDQSDATLVSLPGYQIMEEIGRGGMGVVYRARQTSLDRVVALKMLLTGEFASEAERARFRTEAESAARLRHPGIVQVFDVAEHDGRPYLAMEFVEGSTLEARLREGPLSVSDTARLVEQLALAVGHAHSQGIVHRDLKPANVLLGSKDPSEMSQPKIADFGLAKKLDQVGQTQSGAIVGTPSYMAPEQAEGKGRDAGPAADIHALGAIIYDCLTGRPPFLAANPIDTLLRVLHEDPVPLRQLQPGVPRDLETICLKCLHKKPSDRYATATDLADDLRRFQNGEPVKARPVGVLGRLFRWAKRRPTAAALVVVSGLAITALIVFSLTLAAILDKQRRDADDRADSESRLRSEAVNERNTVAQQKRQIESEKAEAQRQLQLARRNLFTSQLLRVASIHETEPESALRLLHDYTNCPIDLRDPAWRFYERACRRWHKDALHGKSGKMQALRFSPDGRTIATLSDVVSLWDAETGRLRSTLRCDPDDLSHIAFSPDGQHILAIGDHGHLWNVITGRVEGFFLLLNDPHLAAFTPDGKSLLRGRANSLRLFDLTTTQEGRKLNDLPCVVQSLAISPDGYTVAVGGTDGSVRLWDLADHQLKTLLRDSPQENAQPIIACAFNPSGDRLVTTEKETARLWDIGNGAERTIIALDDAQNEPLFSTEADTLILRRPSSNKLTSILLCDATTGGERLSVAGRRFGVSPDARIMATVAPDGDLWLYQVEGFRKFVRVGARYGSVTALEISPDGRTLASAEGSVVRLTNVMPPLWKNELPESLSLEDRWSESTRFCPAGPLITLRRRDGRLNDSEELVLFNVAENRVEVALEDTSTEFMSSGIFSPDGQLVVAFGVAEGAQLHDAKTGRRLMVLDHPNKKVFSASFSPDGRWLATIGEKDVRLWDLSKRRLHAVIGPMLALPHAVFRRDSRQLAVGSDSGRFIGSDESRFTRLIDVSTGKETSRLHTPMGAVPLGYSADGRTLIVSDSWIYFWDVASDREQGVVRDLGAGLHKTILSPNGELLIAMWEKDPAGGGSTVLECVEVATARTIWKHSEPIGRPPVLAFTADGQTFATGSETGQIRLWDTLTGQERATFIGLSQAIVAVAFTPDGRSLLTCTERDAKKIRPPRIFDERRAKVSRTTPAVVWDLSDSSELAMLRSLGLFGAPPRVALRSDGRTIILNEEGGSARVYDLATGREQTSFPSGGPPDLSGEVSAAALSPDGHYAAAGVDRDDVVIWDLLAKKEYATLRTDDHFGSVDCLTFSPDGRTLALGGRGTYPQLWDVATGRFLGKLDSGPRNVNYLGFTPDSRNLLIIGDERFGVWDVSSRKPRHGLAVPRDAAISPDNRLAAVYRDGAVTVWDVMTGEKRGRYKLEAGRVNLLIASDGHTAVTHGDNEPLQVWDLRTGQLKQRLALTSRGLSQMSLSVDGRVLTAIDDSSWVRVWKLKP